MIQADWGNPEQNIIIWHFSAPWTFNEFHIAQRRVHAMIDSVEGYVDSIFLTNVDQAVPAGAITHLRTILARQHKRHRYIIIVGAKSMIIALLNMVVDLVPYFDSQLQFVETQSEAYALIAKLRVNYQPPRTCSTTD